MHKIQLGRLLPMLSLLVGGFILGGTFAVANSGDSSVIDVTSYDEVLDVDGTVVVEDGRGFVVFRDRAGQVTKVQVRGWDPVAKHGILGAGSTVRVTGANDKGKKREYRGHVTVLK